MADMNYFRRNDLVGIFMQKLVFEAMLRVICSPLKVSSSTYLGDELVFKVCCSVKRWCVSPCLVLFVSQICEVPNLVMGNGRPRESSVVSAKR